VTSKELKGASRVAGRFRFPLEKFVSTSQTSRVTTFDDFRESTQYKQHVRPSILNPPPATDPSIRNFVKRWWRARARQLNSRRGFPSIGEAEVLRTFQSGYRFANRVRRRHLCRRY